VHLYRGLVQSIFRQERGNLDALIALELDDLPHLLVVDKGAVAGEFLLECFQQLLGIILLRQALKSSQGLPPIALLNTDMYIIRLRADVLTVSERITVLCKGIVRIEVLNAHAMGREIQMEWGDYKGRKEEEERE